MIKIRLSKQGSKANKFYRIVAVDEKRKRSGKALDTIGFWHPSKSVLQIDNKKVDKWVEKGAIKSLAVKKLIKE